MRPVPQGINHFALSVADLDQSVQFYTDFLGLHLIEQREHDAFIGIGEDCVIGLIQYPGGSSAFEQEMRPKKKGKAFTHFGLQAQSAKEVFTMQEYLIEHNIEITKKAYERWDGASIYFTDPNGYTLEYIYFNPDA